MMLILLVVTAVLICLAASAMGRDADWRRWGVVAATGATVALVWVGMAVAPHQTDGPYGRLRVTLEALSMRIDDGETYRLGGDPVADDVVVAPRAGVRIGRGALPPGVLELSGTEGDVELRLGDQTGPQSWGLIRIRSRGVPDRWLGAVPSSAQTACVSLCGSGSPNRIDLEDARAYFAETTPAQAGADPAALIFTTADGEAFTAGAVADDIVVLRPQDRPVLIDVFEADRGRAPAGVIDGEPGRLTLRRTFSAAVRDGRLILTPQTSQSVSIDNADDDGDRSVLRIAPESDVSSLEGPDERVIGFSLLGRPFAQDLAGVMIDAARQSGQASVAHNQNGRQIDFTSRVEIGARRTAVVSVRPLDFVGGVYPLAALLTTLSIAIFALATWRIRLTDPVAGVAFAAVEFLLAMRVLTAIEGAFVDAAAKAQTSVADAVVAVPLGLLLVLALHPGGRRHRIALAALAITAIGALSAAWEADLASRAILVVAAGIGLAVLFVLARDSRLPKPLSPASVEQDSASGGGYWQRLWRDPWGLYDALTRDRPLAVLSAMAVSICLLRGLFSVIGWREGVLVGTERIALSLLFVPLTLLAFAPLIARAWRGWGTNEVKPLVFRGHSLPGSPMVWPVVVFNLALLVGVFLASYLARDNGFAIYALPVILASLVVSQTRERTGRERLIDGAAALAVGLAIVLMADLSFSADWSAWSVLAVTGVAGLVCLVLRPNALWLAPTAATAAMLLVVNLPFDLAPAPDVTTDIESAVSLEDNDLRLLAALDPQRLADIGTRNAEGLEDTLIHLRSYGDTLLGRGYFNLPDPTVLRAYHLTDNAAAVHLVSPFGRVGAAAFLAVTAALGFVGCRAATRRRDVRPSAWLGGLAALTLSSISIYIVLANLLAAPFTGRNVYFLAPWSMADLIEGLMLVALIIVTLSRRETVADG